MEATREIDVLIVGAGPTGLTLAAELARRGVSCRLIDRAPARAATSRALGLQPRTLEVFDAMGIAPAVLARGGTLDGLRFYGPGRPEPLLTFRLRGLAELHTPYPFVWLLPQDKVETPLLDHLDRLGGAVERGRELVAFREQDGHVEADVRAVSEPAGPVETIPAKWLVGCDGAHSRVRHGLDLSFAGTTSDERFLLADVEANWTREDQLGHAWVSDAGLLALLRLHGTAHWRLIATVEGDDAAAEPSLALVQRLFRERTGDQTTQLSNPLWLSRFTIHRRMVDRYKVGRVLLAGDAAHVHSPVGGQGMNTGIQDAYNLGWKLALVVGGAANPGLLDSYDRERRPVARGVLAGTGLATRLLLARHPLADLLRERVLELPAIQVIIGRRGSELLVNYRRSPLSASEGSSWSAGPRAGDRAPDGPLRRATSDETALFDLLRGTGFTLLLFAGSGAERAKVDDLRALAASLDEEFGSQVAAHLVVDPRAVPVETETGVDALLDPGASLHRRFGAKAGAAYLIRPDGYVGFVGRPPSLAPLRAYLHRLLIPSGGATKVAPQHAVVPKEPRNRSFAAGNDGVLAEPRAAANGPGSTETSDPHRDAAPVRALVG